MRVKMPGDGGADGTQAGAWRARLRAWRAELRDPAPQLAPQLAAERTSPTSKAHLAMERRITHIRWVGAGLCALMAPFLGLDADLPALYLCLAVIAGYNFIFSRLVATDRPAWLLVLYAYGLFDIIMATVIIAATGGGESPFFLAYFPLVVHAAIRFGRWIALGSGIVVTLGYGLVIVATNGFPRVTYGHFLLQVGFITLTAVFAGHLADRARAAELALAQQLDRTRALHSASSALTESLDPAAVATRIVECGRALVGADVAILELREPAPVGAEPGERFSDVTPAGAYLAKLVLQCGLPGQLPPPADAGSTIHVFPSDEALLGMGTREFPPSALLRAPILIGGQWAGDLLLLRPGAFGPGDADIAGAFANQAAVTLENARLYQGAQEQAATDPITGLPNHRSLKERLEEELGRARRQGRALCVLMLDIDHFKVFNDSFGHAAGDEVLQVVAGALRQILRRGDYAARYAGEEFVLVLPNSDLQVGSAVAERLRAAIAGLINRPELDGRLPGPVTVSIGVAAFPEHGEGRDELLHSADLTMYLAKHIGRNQVCLATDLGTARGFDALVAQLTGHLSLPAARWGPHVLNDLERRFAHLAALHPDLDTAASAAGGFSSQTVETVTALAATLDAKDHYTDGHSRHVSTLGVALARAAGCAEEEVEAVRVGGLLHDIGKIGVPEAILNKPGWLTDDEWASLRTHPDIGARILAPLAALRGVIPLVRHHHERWDGQGYPLRIQGAGIPLGARILSICDAYDTMVFDRPYRHGLGHSEAIGRLRVGAGTQFDPELVRLFAALPLADMLMMGSIDEREIKVR